MVFRAMEIFFLGTGTSQGVPMIGCDCAVCRSPNPKNKRGRTSIHVKAGGYGVQVDAAPEFRLQCIENGIDRIDWVVLTHGHADHIAGMDDMRRFVDFRHGEALPVYGSRPTLERMRQMFPYAVRDRPEFPGYPAFVPRAVSPPQTLEFPWGTLDTTNLPHGRFEVLGLVFTERESGKKLTYYTDCKTVEAPQRALAAGSDIVVLDGLRDRPHPTHMTIGEAVEVAVSIGAPQTYLIHMAHRVEHERVDRGLPPGVNLAYDGLRLVL